MSVARSIIKWCDKSFEEALNETDVRKAHRKMSASSIVETLVDAAIILYIPLLITCRVLKNKSVRR